MNIDLVEQVKSELVAVDGGDGYRLDFDRETLDPSVAIVATVAAVTDTSPMEVEPPLTDILDPDAIDRMFQHRVTAENDDVDKVEFFIGGCRVSLYADDRVEVEPPV